MAVIAIGFRLLLIAEIPNLSQDFYRFIWDGRMLLNGFNPYLYTPKNLIEQGTATVHHAQKLVEGMGTLNASHYTNYPPFSQLCYFIAALFGSKSIVTSVVVMRLQIILADIGILYFGKKILEQLRLPINNSFLYLLNPFVIIELTGNLHFEAVMAFFLVLSLYFLLKNLWVLAAVILGISISVKLLTLLFLPVFTLYFVRNLFHKKDWFVTNKNDILKYSSFCFIVIGTNILLFAPFLSPQFIANFSKTISLWFQNFEFNASIYYIVRWVGYQVVGWNIIAKAGKILPLIAILIIGILSLARKNYNPNTLLESMLFCITAYLLLSTTIHPWYLSIPLTLSCFTKFKYIWVWSLTIILSYFAYSNPEFKENLWLVSIEYSIVILFFIYELSKKNPTLVKLKQD
ncbi:mannosyltransferase [Aquimarina agarilytica]|uniref:mannosyltransferase n=1 Tax=Aquimarina agarilytica TaxID=1087449 RepID=UPI001E61A725|nr:mannosyltransferase [Aquimarina agarilytica]